jgi:hypothetical protein
VCQKSGHEKQFETVQAPQFSLYRNASIQIAAIAATTLPSSSAHQSDPV